MPRWSREKILNFLVGEVLKQCPAANPKKVKETVLRLLELPPKPEPK